MEKQKLLESIKAVIKAPKPQNKNLKIGCIGAGFIMEDCQLVAYSDMGFSVEAIASRTQEKAKKVAERFNIPKVYPTWQEMLQDDSLDIIDIAIPPHEQLSVVREAVKHKNIKGILCQKPIAMSLEETREIIRLGEESGIKIAVNSNMRYDQSMRALKYLLDEKLLGTPVLATIEMRAIPHWQTFLQEYNKLELFGMGIHHIDIFRYLFGNPKYITSLCRKDPRTQFEHTDGITQYTYQYEDGLMATSLDDVWAWPNDPCEKDIYIKWRVEGTDGMATGTIGWPLYPKREPSTLKFTCKSFPNEWIEPTWEEVWFPDAFRGTMSSLMVAIENNAEPEISAKDNIATIACVEGCYASISEKKTIELDDILKKS